MDRVSKGVFRYLGRDKWQMEVESVTDGVDIEMDWLALFKLSLSPR